MHGTMGKILSALALAAALSLATATSSAAQVHFGPQVSLADDADVGLGGRITAGVPQYAGLEFAGSFDVFFPDGNYDYWEINGNVLHNFEIAGTTSFRPYAGGGLSIARRDFEGGDGPGDFRDDDTLVGLNLVGGTKFATESPATPFVELRLEIEGGEQFVVTGGLLFP